MWAGSRPRNDGEASGNGRREAQLIPTAANYDRRGLAVIACEAKQSRSRKHILDCFVALLLAMTNQFLGADLGSDCLVNGFRHLRRLREQRIDFRDLLLGEIAILDRLGVDEHV